MVNGKYISFVLLSGILNGIVTVVAYLAFIVIGLGSGNGILAYSGSFFLFVISGLIVGKIAKGFHLGKRLACYGLLISSLILVAILPNIKLLRYVTVSDRLLYFLILVVFMGLPAVYSFHFKLLSD